MAADVLPCAVWYAQRYAQRSKQRLDLAILSFFQNFRRVYVGDQAMHSSKVAFYLLRIDTDTDTDAEAETETETDLPRDAKLAAM